MAEYKKKNVKKVKAVKPKKSSVAENYRVTSFSEKDMPDDIAVKTAKQAKEERKTEKKKAKYLRHEQPNKRVVYTKRTPSELNKTTNAPLRVIKGQKGKKRTRKIIAAGVAFIIIAAVVLMQVLSPTGLSDLIRTKFAAAGLGSGYPLTVSGNAIADIYNVDGCLSVLSDTYFEMYNSDGKEIVSEQHNYASPKAAIGFTRAIVYNEGGTELTAYDAGGKIFSRNLKQDIILAAVGRNGTYAVVCDDDTAAATLSVYNKSNEKLFKWNSQKNLINSVAISNNGKYIAAGTINAQSGEYVSQIEIFGGDSEKPIKELSVKGLVYSVDSFDGNKFIITTGDKAYIYDVSDASEKAMTEDKPIQLKSNCKENGFGIVTGVNGTGDESDLFIYKNADEKLFGGKIISSPNKVVFGSKYIAAAKDNFIYVYNFDGKQVNKINCGVNAKRLSVIDDKIYTVNNVTINAWSIEK